MTLDCATRNYRLVNHERYRKVGIWEVFTAGGDRLTDSQPISDRREPHGVEMKRRSFGAE